MRVLESKPLLLDLDIHIFSAWRSKLFEEVALVLCSRDKRYASRQHTELLVYGLHAQAVAHVGAVVSRIPRHLKRLFQKPETPSACNCNQSRSPQYFTRLWCCWSWNIEGLGSTGHFVLAENFGQGQGFCFR